MATSTVSTTAALSAALATAKAGDTILLAPGAYGPLDVMSRAITGGRVTIAAADMASKPTIQGIKCGQSSGFNFVGLDVTLHPGTGFAVMLGGASDITFDQGRVHGSKPIDAGGLKIDGGSRIAVTNSDFRQMTGGVGVFNSNDITITGNSFRDLQSDSIQISNSSRGKILGNFFTDFRPASGHIDVIQFFKREADKTCEDWEIVGNLYVRGSGWAVQGFFVGSENKTLPYRRFLIDDNALFGAQWHGISVDTAEAFSLTQNLVQGYAGEFAGSWCGMWNSKASTASGNRATSLNFHSNVDVALDGNVTIAPIAEADSPAAISKWLQGRDARLIEMVGVQPAPAPAPEPIPSPPPPAPEPVPAPPPPPVSPILDRARKARTEVNALKNGAARAVYALDQLIVDLGG
jgi:hypothetical protein